MVFTKDYYKNREHPKGMLGKKHTPQTRLRMSRSALTPREEVGAKFWLNILVDEGSGCWEWQGVISNGYGIHYGKAYIGKQQVSAHRFSWLYFFGEWPPAGLHLDHLCRNKCCVNPNHLEPVTSHENTFVRGNSISKQNSLKTHCANGHTFDSENTRLNTYGWRYCHTCKVSNDRRYRANKKNSY